MTSDEIEPRRKGATAYAFEAPVALVGGGLVADAELEAVRSRAGALIAADGGANRFAPAGAPPPDVVIGDMDSLKEPEAWRAALGAGFLRLDEQETTDLEKCLYSVEAPLFLCLGWFGARLDHTLTALSLLVKYADKRILLIGESDVCFLTPLAWRARLSPGARVSFMPLPGARALASSGLRWPIDGLNFAVGGQGGAANEALSGEISATFDRRGAAVIFERRDLDAAIDCLSRAD